MPASSSMLVFFIEQQLDHHDTVATTIGAASVGLAVSCAELGAEKHANLFWMRPFSSGMLGCCRIVLLCQRKLFRCSPQCSLGACPPQHAAEQRHTVYQVRITLFACPETLSIRCLS